MLCILKLMLHVQHRVWLLGAFVLLSGKHIELRFARVRLGSIFLNRSEPRLCLFFFQFGVSEHPMFLCANQNHYATTFCIIVCDGVSKHFGSTSVPTYPSSSPKLA